MISMLVSELYNMVDTLYVGRVIGARAIGGLTIAFPIQRLITSIGFLIAVGASTAVARSLGEGRKDKLKGIISNAITLMVAILSILAIVIYVFKTPIINYLGATESIFPYANEYISIVIFGGVFQCFTIIIGQVLTAFGDAKTNLIATSIGAISNIIIDYLLVVYIPLGISGAAIATVISQIISSIYAFYHFLKIRNEFNVSLGFSLNRKIVSTILTIGFSTFIVEISDAVVSVVLNNVLSSQGDTAIIIIGVTTKVSMFLFITVIGVTSAMQPIAAYNYGAKNLKRLKEVVGSSIKVIISATTVLWLIFMIFTGPILSVFIKEKEILSEAVRAFRVVIAIFPSIVLYYVAIYYYQAIGEPKQALFLSIYRQILAFIPLLFLMVEMFGLVGAWIAYPVSDLLSALTGVYYIMKAKVDMKEKYEELQVLQKASGDGSELAF